MRHAAAAGMFCLLNTAAFGQTVCQTPMPLGSHSPAQAVTDGVAVSVREGNTKLWPARANMRLNLEYVVDLAFSDRSTSSVRLPSGTERGAEILCGHKSVVAIDTAICDYGEGFCVPVHIDIPR
jgi:hypothetical protein